MYCIVYKKVFNKLFQFCHYWYLVNVGTNYRVWMYAEFVKLNK